MPIDHHGVPPVLGYPPPNPVQKKIRPDLGHDRGTRENGRGGPTGLVGLM